MPSTIESGTQSATSTHALGAAATTDPGVYVAMWNLTAMVNGDVVRCYVETAVLATDTPERIYEGSYAHDQGNAPIIASPPVVSMHSVRMYVERVAGAASIDVPWALLRVDA